MADTRTLGSGVVVEITRPRTAMLSEIREKWMNKHPEPSIPTVRNEDYDRDEPNPSDPRYITAMGQWYGSIANVMIDALLATSIKVVDIPDGVIGIDSEELDEILELTGMDVPKTPLKRRVAWLKAVACTADDIEFLEDEMTQKAGATEEMVAERLKLFRGQEEQPTDSGSPTQ